MISYFANPTRFRRLARILEAVGLGLGLPLLALGAWQALLVSPADYQQGETVRILYVHVPAAILAQGLYLSMAIAAVFSLWKGHLLADLFIRAAGPVGAAMTLLCLATGSLWGHPTWGTWWIWDARLTSVLILLFLYLGHRLLIDSFETAERGDRAGAVLLLMGVVNLPVIYFSVYWWNTLHQGKTIKIFAESALDPAMKPALRLMIFGSLLLALALISLRLRAEILGRQILQRQRALWAAEA